MIEKDSEASNTSESLFNAGFIVGNFMLGCLVVAELVVTPVWLEYRSRFRQAGLP